MSDKEKAWKTCQVRIKKANESKLFDEMSRAYKMTPKLENPCPFQDQFRRYPFTACSVSGIKAARA